MAISTSQLFLWVVLCASNLMLAKPTTIHNEIYNPLETKIALYIFGDSLLDVGNNNYLQNSLYSNFYPYGETFFNYSSGRFSNGRTIGDFIAAYLKLPLIPPYLLPGYQRYTDGVNFASAGAGALVGTFQGLYQVITLKTQLRNFKDVEAKLKQSIGAAETKLFLARTLYYFSVGGNDYIAPLTTNSTILQKFTKEQYVDMVIGNITTVLKGVYEIGGRRFGFLNVPLIGCTPLLKASFNTTGGKCVTEANELAKLHNTKLAKALKTLSTQFKGFEYSLFDLYTTFGDRMQNPSKYGFKFGDNLSCCGSGPYRGKSTCGSRVVKYELCKDPNNHVHFDSIHPTDRTSMQLARLVWNGGPDVASPKNIRTLLHIVEDIPKISDS